MEKEDEKGSLGILKKLIPLCINGIGEMFDPSEGLFCHRRVLTPRGLVNKGISTRYTMIALLGLQRYEALGNKSPIDIQIIRKNIHEKKTPIANIGDLGLLIWLTAVAAPKELKQVITSMDLADCLGRYPDARRAKTTELSWVLAGLSHAALALDNKLDDIDQMAHRLYGIIRGNYGGKGIFRHMNRETLAGITRNRFGCFADQAYPIYAFSKYGQAYRNREAIDIAGECASAICDLQGPLGQWWWHYDAQTGKVAGQYPVYSVHQDGMAPMALSALGEVSGKNFDGTIYKSLAWIEGQNELGINLIDTSRNVIWRNIHTGVYRKYLERLLALCRMKDKRISSDNLDILYECWPYHLGWLLYAFADKYVPEQ